MVNLCVTLISLAMALTLLLPAGLGSSFPATPAGNITALSGRVTVTRPAGQSRPLELGDVVHWGEIVETPKDGMARVTLKDNMTVTVRALSRLHVREERGLEGFRYTVELLRAKADAAVDRALMRPVEREGGGARNAVASIRG